MQCELNTLYPDYSKMLHSWYQHLQLTRAGPAVGHTSFFFLEAGGVGPKSAIKLGFETGSVAIITIRTHQSLQLALPETFDIFLLECRNTCGKACQNSLQCPRDTYIKPELKLNAYSFATPRVLFSNVLFTVMLTCWWCFTLRQYSRYPSRSFAVFSHRYMSYFLPDHPATLT